MQALNGETSNGQLACYLNSGQPFEIDTSYDVLMDFHNCSTVNGGFNVAALSSTAGVSTLYFYYGYNGQCSALYGPLVSPASQSTPLQAVAFSVGGSMYVRLGEPGCDMSTECPVPVMSDGVCDSEIGEDAEVELALLDISITDPDGLANTILVYDINSGNDDGLFSISSSSGQLSVADTLDRDIGNPVHLLLVVVTNQEFATNLTVLVEILDENDNDPVPIADLFTATIREGLPAGTFVLTTVFTDQDDGANAILRYSISPPSLDFSLPLSSVPNIITQRMFDYDTGDRFFSFTVRAQDISSSPREGNATVQVTIEDINDNRPFLEVMLREGGEFVEDLGPVNPADVTVIDMDSEAFPILYATVTIPEPLDEDFEMLDLPQGLLPNGFKLSYSNFTLFIVGAGSPNLYAQLLSNVTYENFAMLFQLPLSRNISYTVCDSLSSEFPQSVFSEDTQRAFTATAASSNLIAADAELLLQACLEPVSGDIMVPLIETNDRPLVLGPAEFPAIFEDVPMEENRGVFVSDIFSTVIFDSDRSDELGIAVVENGSPIRAEFAQVESNTECLGLYMSIAGMGTSGCQGQQLGGSDFCECASGAISCIASPSAVIFSCVMGSGASLCSCPLPSQSNLSISLPQHSDITALRLEAGTEVSLDITNLLSFGSTESIMFMSLQPLYYFAFGQAQLQTSGVTANHTLSPYMLDYQPVGVVTESSALLLGPYSLIRWVPVNNMNGDGYLQFKAWDATNRLAPGSRADTTVSSDTSYSLNSANATVEVLPVNDPPIIRLGGQGEDQVNYTTTYTEGGLSVFVSQRNAAVIELDASDMFLSNLEVSISGVGGNCDLPDYPGVSQDVLTYLNTTMVPLDDAVITTTGQACTTYAFLGRMSVDNWRTFITTIRFAVLDEEPSQHTRELAFVISDDLSTSMPAYTTIDVVLVSDICPEISLTTPGPVMYTEHNPPVVLDPVLSVSDGDRAPSIAGATVEIMTTTNDPCTNCRLGVNSTSLPAGVTAIGSGTTLVISGTATPEQYQTLLRTITFEDVGNEPSFSLVTVRFTVMDPTLGSCQQEATANIGVLIQHLNDNPASIYLNYPTSEDFSTTFTEGMGAVRVTGMVRIIDLDGLQSDTYRVEVAIATGCQPAEDRLEFPGGIDSTVVSAYEIATCSLTLEDNATTLERDLSQLVYRNTELDNPSSVPRAINFTVLDGTLPAISAQTILTINPVNDRPRVDLNVASPVSSDVMVILMDQSVSITGANGGEITDADDDFLSQASFTLIEIDAAGQEVVRSDAAFEALELTESVTLSDFGLSGTFISTTGLFVITGRASTANYTTVLNNIQYINRRLPPSDTNRRRVAVTVSDQTLTSDEVFSFVTLQVNRNAPMLDLNGEDPGTNVLADYVLTEPPLTLFPTASLTDIDGDHICTVNISLSGPMSTCLPNSIDFVHAYSDVSVNTIPVANGVDFQLSSRFTDCREAIVFEDILRGVRFGIADTAAVPGTCELQVSATEDRGLTSNIASATIQVAAFNAPPFIDLDRGLSGRDYSTIYFQGGLTRHIVSIFNATTARNISDMTVVGEAMDLAAEAPTVVGDPQDGPSFDDGTLFHGVVILEESNAGFVLRDMDSPSLDYLQVEFFAGANLDNDVIRFPCEPERAIPAYGCNSASPGPISFLAPRCNNSVFDACTRADAQDVCSNLRVTIFCSTVGRKAYRFEYTSNASPDRYETLLGLLGYDFLLSTGGFINQIRLLNISVFDPLSGMANSLAITRLRIQNQDMLVIDADPPSFIVYEDERPLRTCNLYTVRARRLDGTVPSASEVVFSITDGNVGDAFGIGEDGVIFLNNAVDREVISRYDLTVSVRIRTAPLDTTTSATLRVDVIDVNDNHPMTADSYTVNVTEGLAGARVVQVVATDADEGENAELTYLLLGIGAEMFQVNDNGLVTTRVALNRTLEDYYLLVMIIMDRGEIFLSTHTVINVMVITPPPTELAFDPIQPFMIREDTPVGQDLSPALRAFEVGGDPTDSSTVRYRFVQVIAADGLAESPDPFVIDRMTGVISVNRVLDSERSSSYSAVVEAFSIRNMFPPMSVFENVTFDILDVNEFIPMFVGAPYSLSVPENAVVSSTVTRFVATDNDEMNRGLVYSLVPNTPSTLPFQVETDGDLVISSELNFEQVDVYNFMIMVNDDPFLNMPSLPASAMVTVTVLDINDNPPVFVDTPYNVSVLETAPDGQVVLNFSSSDSDSQLNSAVQYSAMGLEMTPFCLDAAAMAIVVCNASFLTSIEMATVFEGSLTATNPPGAGSSDTLVTMEPFSITLELVNEFAPVVSVDMVNHTGYLEVHCGTRTTSEPGTGCLGILVFNFATISSDQDGGDGGDLEYSLLNRDVPFTLDAVTGQLVISDDIDREVQDLYSLEITVSDGGDERGVVRSTAVTINIPIYDINDNPPIILEPFQFNVTEDMTATVTPFGNISVQDPDINGTRTYSLFFFQDPARRPGCIIRDPSDPEYLPIFIDRENGALAFCEAVDFETGPTQFTFTVSVVDAGQIAVGQPMSYEARQEITVNIVDSNDNAPFFPSGQDFAFSVAENAVEATIVGTVIAEDVDTGVNGFLTFTVINGSSATECVDEVPFYTIKISDTAANILQCQGLDFETQELYNIVIQVTDSAPVPMSNITMATVRVLDRNDNAPEFDADLYFMNISETDSSLLMSAVLRVSVTDLDSPPNAESMFAIVSPAVSPFGLRRTNSTSAQVFVATPEMIDFESGPIMYELVIQATNLPAVLGDDVQIANTTVIVSILDVNDNAPIILPPFIFAVRENEPEGTNVGRVLAEDSDTGLSAQLSYYIDSPDAVQTCAPDSNFMINVNTGNISTCQPLDYEEMSVHSVLVVVCDQTVPPMCSNTTFTVNILDLNDNLPVYDEDPFIANLNEHSPTGTVVDLITLSDADSPANSFISFSLPTQILPFAISGNAVVFNGSSSEIDFEGTTRTYIVNVRGENPPFFPDDETQVLDVALVVNIVDRNDQPPVFPRRMDSVQISEHTSEGTVLYELSTTDADTLANSAVTYSILQADSPFAIEGNNVVVANSSAIDYDPPISGRSYMLTIRATNLPAASDDQTQTADFILLVSITDINDNVPVCVGQSSFMLRENSLVNMGLVQLVAEDIDSGRNGNEGIMFFLADVVGDPLCSEVEPFSIDPDSGFISICVPFDYERRTSYEVNFTVCDGGRPMPLCSTCPVLISVIDVNDNAPVVNPPTSFTVSELATPTTLVGCVNAEDADSGQNAQLEYNFADTMDDCSPFSVNVTSGCITVCSVLDFETNQNYSFEINVTDQGSPQMSTVATFTVFVINENDHAPVITSSNITSVSEEEANAQVIRVTAQDIDMPPFNSLSFSLLSDGDGSFAINDRTGVVTTLVPLDREQQEVYVLEVEVSDGLNTDTQILTVFLEDINDNPPEYIGNDTFTFLEETMFDIVLLFRDNDTGSNANLTYFVADPRFVVNSEGVLSNLQGLDRDSLTGGSPIVEVTVSARDISASPLMEAVTLSIVLMDINDNAPMLSPIVSDIVDGTMSGSVVHVIRAIDADFGNNAELRYFLGEPSDDFVIDENSGEIILTHDVIITSNTAEVIFAVVNVSDNGMPMRSTSVLATFFVISSRPFFPERLYAREVPENSLNSSIGQPITAIDRDVNEMNNVFLFYILSVSPYDAGFTVLSDGPNATLLTPAEYLDFEDAGAFTITLGVGRVNMTGVIDDNTTVVVSLLEQNDNVPQLSPVNISVQLPENTPVNTAICRAVAIDFDSGSSGMISYNLTGEGAELFAFRQNGDLILSGDSVDFESTFSYELVYQACDAGMPVRCSEPGFIFIQVINVDDIPPVFSPTTFSRDIPEGFGNQRLVFFMNLTDDDTPLQDLQLSLSPAQASFQAVLVSSGAVLMTTDTPLDRETQDLYEFAVIATDPAGSVARANITIRILDENDERPVILPESGLVVEFIEEGPAVFPGANLAIVDRDILATFPLTSVEVSLQQSPTSSLGYPNEGGICDHANYSLLYDSNSHRLCGLNNCTYLLTRGDLDLRGATLENGILNLPAGTATARNPANIFDGDAFDSFTITIWTRFPAPTSGNILEVQGPGVNVFETRVEMDGSLSILIRTSPTDSRALLSTPPLETHDGQWHQISFVRSDNLTIFFDCMQVATTPDQNEIPSQFQSATFFLGFNLGAVEISEFYFCSLVVVPSSHICCTLTCGEILDVPTPTANVTVDIDARTRSIRLDYVGNDPLRSLPALEDALAAITYENLVTEPHPLDRGFLARAADEVGPGDSSSVVTLRPVLINDQRPVLDLNGDDGGINFETVSDETSISSAIVSDDVVLYEEDSGFWPIASLQIDLLETRGHSLQVLTGSTPTSLSHNLTNDDRTITVFPAGTQPAYPDDYISFLQQARYVNMEEEQGVFTATMWFTVTDTAGITNSPLAVTTITVLPVNDRPELDLDTTDLLSSNSEVIYMERLGVVDILVGTNQRIVDSDSTQLSRARVSFILRPDGQRETLSLDPNLNIAVSSSVFNTATGELVIDHVASFDVWLTILRSVQYRNAEQDPSDVAQRRVSIVIEDDGGAVSLPVSVEIFLQPSNNPPDLFLGGPQIRDISVDFVEDGPCVSIVAPDAALVDSDSSAINFLSIVIIGANSQFESIGYNGTVPNGFLFISGGALIRLGSNTLENYETVVRNILYCNTEDEPNEIGGRQVFFSVQDSGLVTESGNMVPPAASPLSTAFVTIIRVNDRPSVSFMQLDDISIRNTPTPIINSSTIVIDDSDDQLFDVLRIYITNPQDGSENEIIEFSRQLPESSVSRGPTEPADLPGQILYTVTFTGGADVDRVTETISQLRYNNRAPGITVEPPRVVCVDLSDFEEFSELTCVNVVISPPNNFDPVFDPNIITSYNIFESDDSIVVGTFAATDQDVGREGSIVYSIGQVISRLRSSVFVTTDVFSVSSFGELSAVNGLNAEQYNNHEVTLLASDQGNPVRATSIVITINVMDVNDEPPIFIGIPYVATSQREELDPTRAVFTVVAVDNDIVPTDVRYQLLNFQDRFSINERTGVLEYFQQLDAEDIQTYVLNVSATDLGSPPLVSYTTVTFSLIDINDNAAVVDQLISALHVTDGNSSSIGPAIRIVDSDLDPPAISEINVVLTPSQTDLSLSYDQCLVQCQDSRLQQAGLLPSSLDLLALASFVREERTTIGAASCSAVTISRDDNRNNDGYGEINRNLLPLDFAAGDFSVSLVLTQRSEGFVLIVPDSSDRTLPSDSVERVFGLWIRRRDFILSYLTAGTTGEQRATIAITSASSLTTFFNRERDGPPITRHYTIVVQANPPRVTLYVDCVELGSVALVGASVNPLTDPLINLFIGRAQPHPLNGGRLTGQIHGLYYHPTALSESQITDFCSCGFEALVLPASLPSGITGDLSADQHSIRLQGQAGALIPNQGAVTALRAINYTNQFDSPTVDPADPTRTLTFTVTEEGGNEGTTTGFITLVSSDNNLPEVDLNGISSPGSDTSAVFVEDSVPVLVSPDAFITRRTEGFITPTFSRVLVQLDNAIDMSESLNAIASDVISVSISADGRTLEIAGPGLPVEFNPVLQSVSYVNMDNNPTLTPARRVSYLAYDTEGRSNAVPAISTISLTSVNDAPQLSLSVNGSMVQFEEGSAGVAVAPNITIVDVDNTHLQSAEVTLSSPMLSTDTLFVPTGATVSSSYTTSGGLGVLRLTGRASIADYQVALSTVVFNSTDSPFLDVSLETLTRTVNITVFDGEENSASVSVQVQFMPNNDPPIINLPSTTVVFSDGDIMVPIALNASIADSDNRRLISLTVELTNNLDNNLLSDGSQSSLALSYGEGSIADLESILRSIMYVNTAAEPSLLSREITIMVCDFLSCTTAQITVEIRDVNDNHPMFSSANYQFSITEDSGPASTVGTLFVSDADSADSVFTFSSNDTFFRLVPEESSVHIVMTAPLDFETTPEYRLEVRASDGVNNGTAEVLIVIQNINEAPVLTFVPADPALLVGPASQNPLISAGVQLSVVDPDIGDTIPLAVLSLRNVPQGSDESLRWEPVPDYAFQEVETNVYQLSGPGDPVSLTAALRGVVYVAGVNVTEPTTIRTVAIVVTDSVGANSPEAVVTVSLASIPQFSQDVYFVELMEETIIADFLQVRATVESGGDVIEYAVEEGVGVVIDRISGQLSLVEAVDREENASLIFSVFAIDALPPARTGSATINITVLDLDDVRPSISGVGNLTVTRDQPASPFETISVTDSDTIGNIVSGTISISGPEALQPLPFTGRVCVDEPNAVSKMELVCGGLEDGLVLLERNLLGLHSLVSDEYANNILTLTGSSYSLVDANFSRFAGRIEEFTYVMWVRAESSGYVAYFGSPDTTERYFALFYEQNNNQLIITLKREGLAGLAAQIRVSFQLHDNLADEAYHFVMLQYRERNLMCVVDGQSANSVAVVFKEEPFIGEVFSKS